MLTSKINKSMNALLSEYLCDRVSNAKLRDFCSIVANPQSKMAFENFFKTNDIPFDPNNLSNKPQCYLFQAQGKREVELFAQQTRSIDRIKKRLLNSRTVHGSAAEPQLDEGNDSDGNH